MQSQLERTITIGPGTRLGRYEIITHLASGGMASVYLARMSGAAGFQRLVAIKRLHAHIADDEQFVKMFMDEARLAARIRHPNVVPTLDLENGEDGLYLAMEFIEGDSLLGLLRTAAKTGEVLPPSIVLRILIDALHGLNGAHDLKGDRDEPLNLVHRDVSPHNILVGEDGVARITDFGVARAEDRVSQSRDGQIKGKLAYMAPEMTAAVPFDRRADVFSAGIVLWECLTGRRLFKGATDAELLRALIDAPIAHLRDIAPEYPRSLDAVVAKALERKPEARYATAGEFADDLEQAGAAIGIAGPRALSAYVRMVAAERIEQLRSTVREWTEGASARKRLIVIPGQATGPALPQEPGDTSVRVTASAMGDSPEGVLLRPATPSSRPARRAFVLGLLAAMLVVLGAAVATATLVLASDTTAPAQATKRATAEPTATTTPVTTSAPIAAAPIDSVPTLDLTTATPMPRPGMRPPRPLVIPAPPIVSASGAAAASAPPVAPPTAPSSTSFNPEAM